MMRLILLPPIKLASEREMRERPVTQCAVEVGVACGGDVIFAVMTKGTR